MELKTFVNKSITDSYQTVSPPTSTLAFRSKGGKSMMSFEKPIFDQDGQMNRNSMRSLAKIFSGRGSVDSSSSLKMKNVNKVSFS